MPKTTSKLVEDAIDEAKGFFAPMADEPPVGTDAVLLREVMHALEIVWGYSEEELNYGSAAESSLALLGALRTGELVARVFEANERLGSAPIIPRLAWPELPEGEDYRSATGSFWVSEIRYEQDCRGYVGRLPVVLRIQVVPWLASQIRSHPGPAGGRPAIPGVLQAYNYIYPDGHKEAGDSWKVAANKVSDRLGQRLDVSTLKRRVNSEK